MYFPMKLIFSCAIFTLTGVFSGPALSAQTTTDANDEGSALQSALNEGRRLLSQGADDGAEQRLKEIGKKQGDDAATHLELAMNFVRIAFSSRESGDLPTSQKAADKALRHLAKAEKQAQGDDATLASIYQIRGVIYERLAGTTSDAARSYREALRRKPGDETAKARLRQTTGANQQEVPTTQTP